MAIHLGSYVFDGPHSSVAGLAARSGVYAILGRAQAQSSWQVLDIGESGDIQQRVRQHDRQPQWQRQGMRELSCAAYYCAEPERMHVERQLRAHFNPPCGDR